MRALSVRVLLVFLLVTHVTSLTLAEQAPDPLQDLMPNSYGNAFGRVYDAGTGIPIADATVIMQDHGDFPGTGQTVGRTDQSGRYRCGAIIGRYRSKVDVGRVLLSGLAGLLAGSAKKQTKDVMVTEIPVRVVKEGYQTFEGVVPCKLITAERFEMDMEPVLMTKVGNPTSSTAATGWGAVRVLSVSCDPSVARPGTSVTVSAQLQAPRGDVAPISVVCTSKLLGRGQLSPMNRRAEGLVTYAAAFTVPEKARSGTELLQVAVTSSAYDVGAQASGRMLFQVVTNLEERKAAALRAKAYAAEQAGRNAEAAPMLKDLCALPVASAEDCGWLGRIGELLHDYPTATEAWKKAIELTPQKDRLSIAGGYAGALLLAQQPTTVISDLVPLLAGIRKSDYPKRMGPGFAIGVATAYVRTGDLAKADEWYKDIVSWKGTSNLQGLAGLSQELRLMQAQTKLAASPNDAQVLLDYGRVLMDMGRWGEAVDEINKALSLNSGLRTARWDLAYALLHVQGADQRVEENFEAALAEAEHDSQPDAKTRSKDFFVWHRLGLLLYRKACRQQGVSDLQATETLRKSKAALAEGLKLARYTKKTDAYNPWSGYTGPQVRATAGWEYPEAESDFALLAGLQAVTDHPGDYLAHFRVASALAELGQADLAEAAITRTAELQPGFAEIKYAASRLALQKRDSESAKRLLQELLQSNPRHPQANLNLAKLYTEDGDMPAAAACLAKHAQCYGTP